MNKKGISPNELDKMDDKYTYSLLICNLSNPNIPTLKVINYSKQILPKEYYNTQSSAKELKLKQLELLTSNWELYDWTEDNDIQHFFYKKTIQD